MAEILVELPKLAPREREAVFEELCQLQETDILQGQMPSAEEQALLDQELAVFVHDGEPGRPWREVFRDLRARRTA